LAQTHPKIAALGLYLWRPLLMEGRTSLALLGEGDDELNELELVESGEGAARRKPCYARFAQVLLLSLLAVILLALAAHLSSQRLRWTRVSGAPSMLAAAAPSFTIMIDSGSSGTRLKIFKQTGQQVEPVKVEGGIEMDSLASYVDRLSEIKTDLAQMIEKSKSHVPADFQAQARLFMYATAGMRALPPDDQHAVFSQCRSLLSDTGFSPYHFEDARTMSGEMEAAFSYLSVNYLKTGFAPGAEMTGQIEMGGASLQVAFMPEEDVLDNSWTYMLFGQRHLIYAKSYMGYGQNIARLKSQELVARRQSTAYPCFLKGYKEQIKVFKDTPDERTVELEGSGNATGCLELTRQLMHREYECDLKPCAIAGRYMPKVSGNFVGISGLKFALLNLKLDFKSTTPGQLRTAVEEFCGQDFSQLGGETKFRKYECFLGSYVYNVLRALGFADDSTALKFSGDYGWTLGAVVYEAFAQGSPEARRLTDLPGVWSLPVMDHRCYWACRSMNRCAGLAPKLGHSCKQGCSSKCRAVL